MTNTTGYRLYSTEVRHHRPCYFLGRVPLYAGDAAEVLRLAARIRFRLGLDRVFFTPAERRRL